MVISLLHFHFTKKYEFFRFAQILLILVIPVLLCWSLGGLNKSGMVISWSLLAPIGALMFHGVKQSVKWFIVHFILIVVTAIAENYLIGITKPVPTNIISVYSPFEIYFKIWNFFDFETV